MFIKQKFRAVLLLTTVLVSGCLFPEKFDSKITVNQDASYNVKFNGTVAHVLAVAQIFQTKKDLSAKDEASMKAEAVKIAKSKGVTNASYIGNGRFNIDFDNNLEAGKPLNMLDMIKVSTDKDGEMTITSAVINDEAKRQIKALGLNINGKLEVVLPKNALVLSSNSTSSPSFFGMLGSYSWTIGSIEQAPMMRIRFNK